MLRLYRRIRERIAEVTGMSEKKASTYCFFSRPVRAVVKLAP